MNNSKSQPLSGENNKRLNNQDRLYNEATAAWTNISRTVSKDNVSIPNEDSIDEAKDWVDNGSRL